jgi:acid phosphatase type 7
VIQECNSTALKFASRAFSKVQPPSVHGRLSQQDALSLPQGRWLRTDLANHRARCTLAYFHHPLYASGTDDDSPKVKPFWHILYNHHADVILNGNTHRYERFARITPGGKRSSARGIRQFIVGTGGAPGEPQHGPNELRVQAKKVGAPGVLKLSLGSGFYRWRFVAVAGRNYTDSGRARCH